MEARQPLPKEIRYAQYVIYTLAILGFIGLAIFPFVAPVRPTLITYIGDAIGTGAYLFLLFLARQLRQLRLWVHITLIIWAILAILGSVAAALNRVLLTSQGQLQGSTFYQLYYYGSVIIVGVVNVILLYYLTRPVVYEAFQSARRSGVPGSEKSTLSRKVITILVIIASCFFIPGTALLVLAFVFAVTHTPPGSVNGSVSSTFAGLFGGGIVLIGIGGIVDLVARVGALIEMAKAQKWVWFVLTILFGWLVLITYLIAVKPEPDAVSQYPVHPPYSYASPDQPSQNSPSRTQQEVPDRPQE